MASAPTNGRVALVMVIAGALVGIASVLGFVDHYSSTTEPAVGAADGDVRVDVDEPTTSASTTGPPLTAAVVDPVADASSFFASWAGSLSDGDVPALLATLHPEVIARYGADACAGYLERVAGRPTQIEVRSAAGPSSGTYETDGITSTIDDLILIDVVRSDLGPEGGVDETRLAYVEGALRWFTDCGEPLEAGR